MEPLLSEPDLELYDEGPDGIGAVKLRLPLGPVGARNVVSGPRNVAAGPLGGDLGATGRIGERSLGVDLADSCSLCLYAKAEGDRSLMGTGERIASRVAACVKACLLG